MFRIIIFQPLANALVFFYNTIALQDLGVAIVLLTVAIRLLFFPLFHKGARHQAIMQKLQPKLKEIQKKHKEDKAMQAQAMMALYREHNINPLSSILFLVVQIPVLIALYRIFLMDFSAESFSAVLYPFIAIPSLFGSSFLGLINLHEPSILMVGLAAIAQYFQGRLTLRKGTRKEDETQAEKVARQMIVIGPILTVLIFSRLPAAVGLYWLTTSVFSVGQQIIVNRSIHDHKPNSMETISRGSGGQDGTRRSQD